MEKKRILPARRIIQTVGEDTLIATNVVAEEPGHVQLSGKDSLRVLDLLENPPAPNSKLLAAAQALPKRA
jgi:uncharacterized protein (DUF1778 family)